MEYGEKGICIVGRVIGCARQEAGFVSYSSLSDTSQWVQSLRSDLDK